MKKFLGVIGILLLLTFVVPVYAEVEEQDSVLSKVDLSQFIYSYGTVLRVSDKEVVLQEYDYDSDVEKEVSYEVNADTKLEGLKSVTELLTEDVIEIYYVEQEGQRTAKIIHREVIEDEAANSGAEL